MPWLGTNARAAGDRGADGVCAAADPAQYVCGDSERRGSGADRCGQCAGDDGVAAAVQGGAAAGGECDPGRVADGDGDVRGVATIAAAIGAGGLGELIFRGVASVDNGLVLAGAIPAALLALVADGVLGFAGEADDGAAEDEQGSVRERVRGWKAWASSLRAAGMHRVFRWSVRARRGCDGVPSWRLLVVGLFGSGPVRRRDGSHGRDDWGEELYGAGGAGRVAGAGD